MTAARRRVLHIVRPAAEASGPRPAAGPPSSPPDGDRVVHLRSLEPAQLVPLIFEYDAVVVW